MSARNEVNATAQLGKTQKIMKNALKLLDLRRLGFAALFLSLLTFIPLTDPDYFWHQKTGQYLLEMGRLPSGDIFSYTFAGRPWVLHEWLFELLLASIYAQLGAFGVKLMVAFLATTTLVITYTMANRILGKPYAALCLALLFFIFGATGISPRPQMLTFFFFAAFLRVLIGFKYYRENRGLLALPALMMLWVNFHGGYAAGLALLALFAACEWLKFLAMEHRDSEQRRRLRWLSLTAIATLLSSLVNPYFVWLWLYPFQVMGMEASSTYITEWHSPNFHHLQNQGYLVLVFAFLIVTTYRQRKADITELTVPLFFTAMGFVASRHIPLAAIVLIPFSAAALAQHPLTQIIPERWLRGCSAWHARLIRKDHDLGDKEYLFNWLLLGVLISGFLLYYPIYHAKDSEKANAQVPVKAVDFILQAGIRGRMFNTYHYGGYLIYRLYPTQKVFIDGRADIYGDAFMKEYIEISGGSENWEKLFGRHNIDYVLIQRNEPLRQLLLARGDFKLVYEDEVNSLLLRNREEYAKIIAKYPH